MSYPRHSHADQQVFRTIMQNPGTFLNQVRHLDQRSNTLFG